MTVITLSRQLGSHGEEIAASVAKTLGLHLIDAETINQAARQAGVPQMALAELTHEGQRGLANRMLNALRAMPTLQGPSAASRRASETGDAPTGAPDLSPAAAPPFAGIFSPTVPPISASIEQYVRMVDLVIRGLARAGNVLIVGRGGQILLKKHSGALHLQIVAPLAHRIGVIMAREGLKQRSAQSRLRASDRARFDYVRRYHDADWLDPTLYHLVINTGYTPIPKAVSLIITAHRALSDRSPKVAQDE